MINISFLFIFMILIMVWIGCRVLTYRKLKSINKLREAIVTLFFIYFLTVVYFTFFKSGCLCISIEHSFYANLYANLIPLKETFKMFADNHMGLKNSLYNVIGNILLFVPLGFFIPLLFDKCNRVPKVLLYGLISSLTIELVQFFTAFNIADIDDVIFNTTGAVLGILCYRIFYSLIKIIKLSHFLEKVKDFEKTKLIPLAAKPLAVMFLCSGIAILYSIYSVSYPSNIFDKDTSTQAFASNNNNKEIVYKDFSKYKFILNDYGDYLQLSQFKKLPGNRYMKLNDSQLSLKSNNYGYTLNTIYNNTNSSVGLMVLGRNANAKTIVINFNGKEYKETLAANSNFITTFPSFEKLSDTTDLYNIFSAKSSKNLQIKFLDEAGKEYTDIKFTK